jgi:hypothetical protein
MTGRDDEFDDFLRRSKPIFRRVDEDELEPPAELDRIVLRQAREAIETARPQRVFRGPRWGAPIALAATLVVSLAVVFHGRAPEKTPVGEVTVRSIAREIPAPAPATEADTHADASGESRAAPREATAAPLRSEAADNAPYVVGIVPQDAAAPGSQTPALVSDAEASRYTAPPPAPAVARTSMSVAKARNEGDVPIPAWRGDSTTWLAEIERLRAAGETARADAEMAEYNRQHRAYAGAPDR